MHIASVANAVGTRERYTQMCGNYDQELQNALLGLEGNLKRSVIEFFERYRGKKPPLDASGKSLWALSIVGAAFDLESGVLKIREMTDREIALMIPRYRGAIDIIDALVRKIDADRL